MASYIQRRKFLAVLGGAAAWPLGVRAQQGERVRRIGVLMTLAAGDPESLRRMTAFVQGLQELGWTDGRNVRIDYRWATSDTDRIRYAAELIALAPDVMIATSGATVGALQRTSRTVPIVFVTVIDPVGGGWVASLARPGGNATGFASREFSMSGKWLELLKEIAPRVSRVAVLREKPAELPVQAPTKFELVINLKTAKALGLEIPPMLLARVDEKRPELQAYSRIRIRNGCGLPVATGVRS